MTHDVKNLRVRRTQKLLREALIDLIDERGFEALTIGEITERAMVSRAAFYRNYQDKYDLVEKIFDEAMDNLMQALHDQGPGEQFHALWVTFFEHIAEYERLYRALLGRKGSLWFERKMRGSLVELIRAHEQVPIGHNDMQSFSLTSANEFVPDAMAALFVEAIAWWLEHDRPYTAQEMARRCSALAFALFNEVSKWQ